MRVEPTAGRRHGLSLEDYFAGRTKGWGLVEDRFGRLRRRFTMEIVGEALPEGLRLDERIQFDDGEDSARTWLLTALGGGRYEGRTHDLVGRALGRVAKDSFQWRYRLRLPIGGRRMVVDFDDRMHVLPDGVMINRAGLSKFGIGLAQVTITFRRVRDQAAGLQAAAA